MTADPLEHLVDLTVAGDEAAWQALWREVEPRLERVVRQPRFLAHLGQREDDRRNIVVEVMGRLRADRFQRLVRYQAARTSNPELRFMTWLRVVAKRVGIDYLRAHPEYLDHRRQDRPGAWVEPGTLPSASRLPGERPPVTDRGTAQQLLRYAAGAGPDVQHRALERWVQGETYDDIAAGLGLASAADGERAVRAAIERLRRRFRAVGGAS